MHGRMLWLLPLWAVLAAGPVAAQTAPEKTGAAPAAATFVAVLAPEFSQRISEGARSTLVQRLVEGLKVARFDVLAGDDIGRRLGVDVAAAACRSRECYPQLAAKLRVAYLVVATIRQAERSYDLQLQLVRGRSGDVAAEIRERCDICGIEEVGEKMGLAASTLRTKLEALMVGPARLTVRSQPSGASSRPTRTCPPRATAAGISGKMSTPRLAIIHGAPGDSHSSSRT